MQSQNHILDAPPTDSNFAETINVSGKSNYGAPLYKPLLMNNWMSNIAQQYAIDSFDYSTTSIYDSVLFRKGISHYSGLTLTANLPWFVWFTEMYQSFECHFDLVLIPVKHSAHRGVISVSCTLFGATPENISENFLPVEHFDISGEDTVEYVYPIPNVYAFSAKTFYEKGRNMTTKDTAATVPQFSTLLTTVDIRAVTPLASSSMLPPTITFIVCLRPDLSTLKLHNPVLGSNRRFVNADRFPTWHHD
nr:MAG: putative capsid protein 2 [Myotis brandtii picorna-like virus 1]